MCSYPMPLKIKSMVDKYSLMEKAMRLRIKKYLNIKGFFADIIWTMLAPVLCWRWCHWGLHWSILFTLMWFIYHTINIFRILFQASLQNNKQKKKRYSLKKNVLVNNFQYLFLAKWEEFSETKRGFSPSLTNIQ